MAFAARAWFAGPGGSVPGLWRKNMH